MHLQDRAAFAALLTLVVLQGIMLAALFAGVPPHPPAEVAPFGMAPLLAASLSAALAAMVMGPTEASSGRGLTILAVLLALISFGPQKVVDPAFSRIWPAVFTAWIAFAVLAVRLRVSIRYGGERQWD